MFAIAYKEKDGTDFNGIPWIEICPYDLKDAKKTAKIMESEGYKDVTLFNDIYTHERCLTWTDAINTKINF